MIFDFDDHSNGNEARISLWHYRTPGSATALMSTIIIVLGKGGGAGILKSFLRKDNLEENFCSRD